MRSWSFVFLAAFYVGCSDASSPERPSGGGGSGSTSATTGGGGSTGSNTTTSTTTGNPSGTGSSSTTTSGGNGGSSSGSGGGAGGANGGSGGTSNATGGRGGASGSGGSGSGGASKDASVETGPPPPPPDPGPLSGGGSGCNDVDPNHQGSATYYTLLSSTNVGHCSFDPLPSQPPYWLAMNFQRYGKSSDCGACLQVTGPSGSATFIVVDECPNSGADPLCMSMEHLDLAPQGFSAIGGNGRIDSLRWNYVACDVQSNMVEVAAQSNSNNFFATVGVRKHRYRIAKVELVTGMTRLPLMRRDDNYFIIDSTTPAGSAGMALGPYRLRITDIYGHWIENKVTLMAGRSTSMALQFPKCPAGGGSDGGP